MILNFSVGGNQNVWRKPTEACMELQHQIHMQLLAIVWLPFFFLATTLPVTTLCVCVCCIVCVCDCVMVIHEPDTQIMLHTHMHKAVTGYVVKAKMLLFRQRQSDYIAALVEGKCSSTKPTFLATELCAILIQNRPPTFLALLDIELGTYCTASKSSISGPHYFLKFLAWKRTAETAVSWLYQHIQQLKDKFCI